MCILERDINYVTLKHIAHIAAKIIDIKIPATDEINIKNFNSFRFLSTQKSPI